MHTLLIRFALVILLYPATGIAADAIGNALIVKGVVTASGTTGLRTIAKGSEIFLGETISTASDSFVVFTMADDSKISLRPSTELTLEKFSDQSGQEEALFDLLKGGLRAISGAIGKARPEHYQVETEVATVGIRGTDFLVRLCDNDCKEEELEFGALPRQNSAPSGGGSPTRRKQLKKFDSQNNAGSGSFIECKPVAEIKKGLYVAVFDGRIYVRNADQEVELEAVEALFAEDREILCLGEIPHFIMRDNFLSKEPGETITLFNILKNIDEDRQRCEIPEA